MPLEKYKIAISQHIEDYVTVEKTPRSLYEPMDYILSIGGKKIRSALVLMVTEMFMGDYKDALDVAMAVEIFHNFTLVHDDIMDAAEFRRGKTTVHHKWDENTGILSGDVMLILAYQILESYPASLHKDLSTIISKTAREVCEGQKYDLDFETQSEVSYDEYIHMISYKTAVLVGASMQIGAIVAQQDDTIQEAIYKYGYYLGIAFQLQDDYLDTFGDPKKFGKKIGGDIIENKKTALYIKSLENLSDDKTTQLKALFEESSSDNVDEKIYKVTQLYLDAGIPELLKSEIKKYTLLSNQYLEKITSFSDTAKQEFISFGKNLMNRQV